MFRESSQDANEANPHGTGEGLAIWSGYAQFFS